MLHGEPPAVAHDYERHFRSRATTVLDPAYSSSLLFGARSWPAYVIADAEGTIVYNASELLSRDKSIRPLLDKLASSSGTKKLPKHAPASARRRARLAVDAKSGEPWAIFESVSGRAKSVRIGQLTEKGIAAAVEVCSADTAPCAPAIVAHPTSGFWVAWIANVDRRDEVFVSRFVGGETGRVHRVTTSDDDAAAPALAVDGAGRLWVTYYRWNKQFRTSRDRDVFARFFDGKQWSEEMRVSPAVPAVDDHTDPDIVADPSDPDRVWIAWSWDYHSSLKENELHVDQPTIFVRAIEPTGPAADPVCLGVTTASGGKRAIDLCPRLAIDEKGGVYCAFDSMRAGKRRLVAWRGGDGGFEKTVDLRGTDRAFAGPIVAIVGGKPVLAWSRQHRDGPIEMSWMPMGGEEVRLGAGRVVDVAVAKDGLWLVYETKDGTIGGKRL